MKKENSIILFNQKEIRRHFDEEKELWYFSIIDVIDQFLVKLKDRENIGTTLRKNY